MSTMSQPHLVLASQSPRRRELLSLLGVPFAVTNPRVSEIPRDDETPVELVARLSRAKAHAADPDRPGQALVIACDTIVALYNESEPGKVLGKPRGEAEARAMLRQLRGRPHVVFSAATVSDARRGSATELVKTELRMRAYDDDEIEAYLASGDPLDKAGAYGIQHQGFRPVAELEGCYANVMGLPLCHVARELHSREIETAVEIPAACEAHTGYACRIGHQIVASR